MRFAGGGCVLLLGLVLAAAAPTRADELRTWTDSSGTHRVKAKFVSIEDGTVTLEREDGEKVEIELKKLSKADQRYVESQQESPFKSSKPGPFKPKRGSKKDAAAEDPAAEAKLLTPSLAEARPVDIGKSLSGWKVEVVGKTPPTTAKARAIALPAHANFFEKTTSLVLSAAGNRAVVGYKHDDHRKGGTTRVVLADLERGKLLGAATTSGLFEPLSLADDGKRILVRSDDFGHGKQDRLEIWTLASSGIEPKVRWIPYDEDKGADRDVRWAAFVSNDQALSCSSGGKIVLWDLESTRPVYWLQAKSGCTPALSPDRKLLAFSTDKEVGVLDVDSGELVAMQPAPTMAWPTFAFDPTGKRLACLAFDNLYVWDLGDGKLYREMTTNGLHTDSKIAWTGADHVLLGHRYLIDLENQVRLWDYQNAERAKSVGEQVWFEVSDGHQRPGALVPAKLPTTDIEKSLKNAMQDPRFFVLRPGVTVKINVDGLPDAADRDKAKASLTAKLESNGVKVGDAGDLELIASIERGEEREMQYRMFGPGFGVKTYKIRPVSSRVKFVYQGKDAWQTQAVNIPFFVHLKKGETMEDHLRASEKPNYGFFETVALPKLLTRPTGQPTLGTSRVTLGGIR